MKVLAIESSCDETAIAIVDDQKKIYAHLVKSQIKIHQKYGGVIPELSARSHLEIIDNLINETLAQANLQLKDIDAFASTAGPGLIGGLIVGLTCAKTLASIYQKPFLAINHLEGHILAIRLVENIDYEFIALLVSGGHCQSLICYGPGNYYKIGETIDDALGETFDKVAQMLGMQYPGGPEIENLAKMGNAERFKFPKPLIDQKLIDQQFNFSFAGLKTAVKRQIEKLTNQDFNHYSSPSILSIQDKADICASFQKTISEILKNRLDNIFKNCLKVKELNNSNLKLIISGGVACNNFIFNNLQELSKKHNFKLIVPPKNLCTDNALMIAWAGIEKLKLNKIDNLGFQPRCKWPL